MGSTVLYLYVNELVSDDIYQLCGRLFGSFFMSIFSISILTIDRLIAVPYALRYPSIITEFRANFLICFTWLAVTFLVVIQGAIYIGISAFIEARVRIYQLTSSFILGTFVLFIGNLRLYLVVRSKQQCSRNYETQSTILPRNTGVVGEKTNMDRPHKSLVKTFSDSKILFWMTIIFVVCLLPIVIFYVAYLNNKVGNAYLYTYIICMTLAASNALFNPVMYLMKRKDFRKRFSELFIQCK